MLLLQEHLLNPRIFSIKYNLFYPDVVKNFIWKGKQTLVMMLFPSNLLFFLSHFVPRHLVEYDEKTYLILSSRS